MDNIVAAWPVLLIILLLLANVVLQYRSLSINIKYKEGDILWQRQMAQSFKEMAFASGKYMAYDLEQRELMYTSLAADIRAKMQDPRFWEEVTTAVRDGYMTVDLDAVEIEKHHEEVSEVR